MDEFNYCSSCYYFNCEEYIDLDTNKEKTALFCDKGNNDYIAWKKLCCGDYRDIWEGRKKSLQEGSGRLVYGRKEG